MLLWTTIQPPEMVSIGEPSFAFDVDSNTTGAGDEEIFPFGSYPCASAKLWSPEAWLVCLRCKAPQTDDPAIATERFFENKSSTIVCLLRQQLGPGSPLKASSLLTSATSIRGPRRGVR